MPDYTPFLLPLLFNSAGQDSPPVRSPLEEESHIENLDTACFPGWESIARKIRKQYGIPFLFETPVDWSFRKSGSATETGSIRASSQIPLRYVLMADRNGLNHFVIEHPEALILYDQLAGPAMDLLLARPSLFAQLWLQGQSTSQWVAGPVPLRAQSERQALDSLLLDFVRSFHPSDWHLEPGRSQYKSRLRIDGRLCEDQVYSPTKAKWLINSMTRACDLGEIPARRELDGSMTLDPGAAASIRLRISIIPSMHGDSLVARFLYPEDQKVTGPGQLGFNSDQVRLLQEEYRKREGLWVVAGPTGAGKSTTLHAMLHWSVEANEKVLTVEDPVERTVDGVQQVPVGNPPGMTYAIALKAFLRQDPDSILIGEIRDAETAALAVQAARTGHRVLCSLHARNPEGILHRFEDLGQPVADLGPVLRLLILQRLVPMVCPRCMKRIPLDDQLCNRLPPSLTPVPEWIAGASGCGSCMNGYRGRTAIAWCASWPCALDDRDIYLATAWSLLCRGKITLHTLLSLVSREIRDCFPLCQEGGFC